MVFVVTLSDRALLAELSQLRTTQRLTKAFAKNTAEPRHYSRLAMILREDDSGNRHLAWLGVVAQQGASGRFDRTITIDPLREVFDDIPVSGHAGILKDAAPAQQREFQSACRIGGVGVIGNDTWAAVRAEITRRSAGLEVLVGWLMAVANPVILDSRNEADARWQEERDALGMTARIAGIQPTELAGWQRPASNDEPYLAGLIPAPVEHSLIDHDSRVFFGNAVFHDWTQSSSTRCDIHVFADASGRRVEIANVNATPVEARLGTDLIYYHEQTASFVLVQYKRLDPDRSLSVDDRLMEQLTRLEQVRTLSRTAQEPDDWRLSHDPCFVKLAHWPIGPSPCPADELVPGMYLPVSYVRLLLSHESTLSGRTHQDGIAGRLLGYKQVDRYLNNTQFIELVKNGLTGTVGVTAEQLRELVRSRLEAGNGAVVAVERGNETTRERQTRIRQRSSSSGRRNRLHHMESPMSD
ncbi:hypothetical protein [Nocardia rosealba]|uniref:hypothetical protein n=1 Tax=Nocardia rosealba TaxID=2878563 RepID=UPI001CDA2E6C|nr:hypothetical protein [Nocardia rosealba]MCA2210560.1 hypothetical protein [Nocardia rosealba]